MTTIRESNARSGSVTMRGTVKSWHIYGLTTPDGEVFCADCADHNDFDVDNDTESTPVFADSDYSSLVCDCCHRPLGE